VFHSFKLSPSSPSHLPDKFNFLVFFTMMLSAMISLALSFLALTSATPLSTRGPCKPDFGGPPGFEVSIVNKGQSKEWGLPPGSPGSGTKIIAHPASFSLAEFRVRHLPNGEYSIKYVSLAS
jgi:hypothetical protein